VTLGSTLTNEIIDQLIQEFKDWGAVFKVYPIQAGV